LSLQLESTRTFYLSLLDDSLKSSAIDLKIGNIHGFVPFNWQIERVKIADRHGLWLDIKNLHFDWSFFSLIAQKIKVKTISASSISIYRLPDIPLSREKNPQQNKQNNNSALSISLPFVFEINELKLEKILIAKKLLDGLSEPQSKTKQDFFL